MMRVLALCNSDWLAFPALNQLHQQGLLAGVVIPAKSAGVLAPSLKKMGIAEDAVFETDKKNLAQALSNAIKSLTPEVVMVFTFPWKIPATLLNLPAKGFINFHFGLLPAYKGTDPVFWQLKNGESNGGISVHVMTDEVDEGPLLLVQPMPVIPGETYGIHCQRLGMLAAQVLEKVFNLLDSPECNFINNQGGEFLKSPSIAALTINWQTQTADEIERLVNAANPKYGGAITTIRQTQVQLLEVAMADLNSPVLNAPGTIVYADAVYGLIVACINNRHLQLRIVSLPEGYISGIKLFNMGFKPGEVFN
ncbi:hypothetical protein MUY27_16665 [Mucilaginibacter sp. RS28]|uniref:Methionyl-tRNA formyltransferase n=1 Tax=Mucilaginibacter straminoryzae TaxID=2932774 RepID=A0A9X2BCU1_9SPHI|nr:formyltransferase family protein [Mucilaginibacter straminoryzae]MCJ8211352.1 hypothetical protein [Mucilaginibacter straminoryzae]